MREMLRVNMNNLECTTLEMPSEYQMLGGRGLTSTIIAKEVNPECDPLGPNNKIIIAPGLLGGSNVPSAQRLSIGSKSPLTGGIKEANAGGTSALKLGRLGFAAIIIEGKSQSKDTYILKITKDAIRLENANELKGFPNYKLSEILRNKYGSKIGLISIGPAGEMLMSAASIAVIDKDGIPCRHAARGGLGAVLGSKGIKAIVIDDEGTSRKEPVLPEQFKVYVKEVTELMLERPRIKTALPNYGTAAMLGVSNKAGTLPTRNFSSGRFEGAGNIDGDALAKLIDERKGQRSHSCYAGCFIKCSNVLPDSSGNHLTASLEYETLAMLGSNCGIDDLDTIATLDRLCDDYGLDTIEVGNAIGVAMEAGVLSFGDKGEIIKLINEIGKGTTLGRVIGQGAVITGKVFGVNRVAAVKGQAIPAWEPRRAVATGVSLITSPQGADHTTGRMPGVAELEHLNKGKIVSISRELQIKMCVVDSMGLCFFADSAPETFDYLAKFVTTLYGRETSVSDLIEMGKTILKTEYEFNKKAGFTKVDDRLPEFMLTESIPPTNSTFNVTNDEIDEMFIM